MRPDAARVLRAYACKKIAFMREIAAVAHPEDDGSAMLLALGLPMLGWAPPARGLMQRDIEPTTTIAEFMADRGPRNAA